MPSVGVVHEGLGLEAGYGRGPSRGRPPASTSVAVGHVAGQAEPRRTPGRAPGLADLHRLVRRVAGDRERHRLAHEAVGGRRHVPDLDRRAARRWCGPRAGPAPPARGCSRAEISLPSVVHAPTVVASEHQLVPRGVEPPVELPADLAHGPEVRRSRRPRAARRWAGLGSATRASATWIPSARSRGEQRRRTAVGRDPGRERRRRGRPTSRGSAGSRAGGGTTRSRRSRPPRRRSRPPGSGRPARCSSSWCCQ